MANHVRQQIREAVALQITGLTTTGANVFQTRSHLLTDQELPCVCVSTKEETNESASMGYPRLVDRTLIVRIEAVAKQVSNIDDTLDTICKEVESSLAGHIVAFAPLIKDLRLAETSIEVDAHSEKPIGIATMLWTAEYRTSETAPDTAL